MKTIPGRLEYLTVNYSRNVGVLDCDLCPGEGRAVQSGDSAEVCRIKRTWARFF
jgi:hypothetical protein